MAETAARAELALRYDRAADVSRDRLGEVRHGLLVRTRVPLQAGDRPRVVVELAHEKITLRLDGEVRWVTPLVNGALVGVGLVPSSHRDEVQLDLLFGHRTAGGPPRMPPPAAVGPVAAATAATVAAAPALTPAPRAAATPLSVAMLQPNAVLRQVLVNALSRFGKERGGWDVSVEARPDAEGFLEILSARERGLAVIDCDVLGAAVEPLLVAIRSHDAWRRLPLVLLASDARTRLEDTHAVFLEKPVVMKSFVDLVGILVAGARA